MKNQIRKKSDEMRYLNEARRSSRIFPDGELIPHESPDFLLLANGRTIGIEVTDLCIEHQRAEDVKLSRVPDRARDLYTALSNSGAREVSATFAPRTEHLSVHTLAKGLATFVHSNPDGAFHWNDRELPEGYSYITNCPARESGGSWLTSHCTDSTLAPKELLESRIAEKNLLLPNYHPEVAEIWLLIVNDQFLGAGEVYTRPDRLGAC